MIKSNNINKETPSGGWCTGFFETWIRWHFELRGWRTFYIWKKFPLSELCEAHDEKCSSHTFFDLLKEYKVVGGFLIGLVASIACWVKYTDDMKKRV